MLDSRNQGEGGQIGYSGAAVVPTSASPLRATTMAAVASPTAAAAAVAAISRAIWTTTFHSDRADADPRCLDDWGREATLRPQFMSIFGW
jgi:hypothetical protein